IAEWFPPARVQAAADRYRALYPEHAVERALLLPGALEAVRAVRECGGRVAVITGKHEPNARLHLTAAGLDADVLVGDLWAETKGAALREHGAAVYVGDHLGDIAGARAADAVAVGVATGPYGAAELAEAGADVVLDDLTGFPAWLAGYLASATAAGA
ncbi:HAD family hydrolase, partial [Kitasatospora sp. MBT63]